MSVLMAVGQVVSINVRDIKPSGQQNFKAFKKVEYYLVNSGASTPVKIVGSGEDVRYKVGETVKIPVWTSYRVDYDKRKLFYELREVKGGK